MLLPLIKIVQAIFWIYTMLILARIIGSWFPNFSRHKIMQFVAFYTDPYLNLFRRIIPPLGMLDLSPLAAFFALQLLEKGVIYLLVRIVPC